MDLTAVKQLVLSWTLRYRWALAVIAAGLILLCLPSGKEKSGEVVQAPVEQEITLEQQLEQILSRVEGAGKVRVLLTVASGEQTHYQTDEDTSHSPDSGDLRRETVLVTGAGREQTGLVRRIDSPSYRGAVVVSQGADRASVRLALVEAVKTATGLTADKISVLKMK